MGFRDIFAARSRKLTWKQLPADHVVEKGNAAFTPQPIKKDEDYIVLRLNEMWLVNSRVLWRKSYPMLHAFLEYGTRTEHAVVGPGQLRELGERGLERVSTFNRRIFGPVPCRGDELRALVGLYAVPGEDSSKALIDVVGNIAGLAGPTGAASAKVASLLRDSVDRIVGLNGTSLQIGVENSWPATKPLTTGYFVAIDADAAALDMSMLWLDSDRRLLIGKDPFQAKLYSDHDYFVLGIERQLHRTDAATLPAVAEAEAALEAVLSGTATFEEKCKQMTALWPKYEGALLTSAELTEKDGKLIAATAKAKLKERLQSLKSAFEFKGASTAAGGTPFDLVEQELRDPAATMVTVSELDAQLQSVDFTAG